ncbi:MAG TPA: hypothetical protein VFZ38_10710 [Vicinamibacterales bacterium]
MSGGAVERLCVFCRHWSFYGGDYGYSELTPGSDSEMDCQKGKWGRNFRLKDLIGEDDFRRIIMTAKTCPDYARPTPPHASGAGAE